MRAKKKKYRPHNKLTSIPPRVNGKNNFYLFLFFVKTHRNEFKIRDKNFKKHQRTNNNEKKNENSPPKKKPTNFIANIFL